MSRSLSSSLAHTLAATFAVGVVAGSASAQARPAIRPLGPVVASSRDSLSLVTNIRALPGGRLLINDVSSRRVILVDSTFALLSVVADSTPSTANAYGPRSGSLIPFRGDSTLFVDAASLSMLVIDPQGKIGRVMSVPRAQDAMMLAAGGMGAGAYYANGSLIYRGMPGMQMRMAGPGASGGAPGAMPIPQIPDTMPVVRVNLQTRAVDTLAFVKIPVPKLNISRADDKISITSEVNPLPLIDEWAVTSTGDIAFLRGKDYHVDWVTTTGERKATPKIAFDWKRLSDEDKVKLADSVQKILDKNFASGAQGGQALAQGFSQMMGGSGAPAGGAPRVMMSFEMRGGDGAGPGGPTRAPQMSQPKVSVVSPSELPDYQPPFFAGSARADADGNIWVLTIPTKPQPAGSVYDVINGKGEVTERVLVPEGRSILGFAPGGIVYLSKRDGTNTTIERARIR